MSLACTTATALEPLAWDFELRQLQLGIDTLTYNFGKQVIKFVCTTSIAALKSFLARPSKRDWRSCRLRRL